MPDGAAIRRREQGRVRRAAALAAAFLACSGCRSIPNFRLEADPSQRPFAPIVQAFCLKKKVRCDIHFGDPNASGRALRQNKPPAFDAVWPSSTIWITRNDLHNRVQDQKSIAVDPVVLGIRSDVATRLGWVGEPVSWADIRLAVTTGKLSYITPNPGGSSAGSLIYLSMLSRGHIIDEMTLTDPSSQLAAGQLIAGASRTAESPMALQEDYLTLAKEKRGPTGIWALESTLKEINVGLRIERRPLLYAIYPNEGAAAADSPLGYVEHGQSAEVRAFFNLLQAHLLAPKRQAIIARGGKRPLAAGAPSPPPQPDWNYNPSSKIVVVKPPPPVLTQRALALYETTLRRPSLTGFCLDYSGSMEGTEERQLREALSTLLGPPIGAGEIPKWSTRDRLLFLPFDKTVRTVWQGDGGQISLNRIFRGLAAEKAHGGSSAYGCAKQAIRTMSPYLGKGYAPAVVLLTDGHSDGATAFEAFWRKHGHGVPIFVVTLGKADKREMAGLAGVTEGRVFDGSRDLAGALDAARDYN